MRTQTVTDRELARCFDLHAAAREVDAHAGDLIAFMNQHHIGVDPHADEIALFAVVPTGLTHGFDLPLGYGLSCSYNSR